MCAEPSWYLRFRGDEDKRKTKAKQVRRVAAVPLSDAVILATANTSHAHARGLAWPGGAQVAEAQLERMREVEEGDMASLFGDL